MSYRESWYPEKKPVSFSDLASRLDTELKRTGIVYHDMRWEQQLEVQLLGSSPAVSTSANRAGRVEIDRLEGPVCARAVPPPVHPSPIRYFLDGSQRTFPAYLFGTVPVIGAISAAAILERDDLGRVRVMPGTLRRHQAMLTPLRQSDVAPFLQIAENIGLDIVDPLAHITNDVEYAEIAADYGRLIEFGHKAANNLRAKLELELLREWSYRNDYPTDDKWIVVDGILPFSLPRAVGLVKSFTRQYLVGEEAIQMFHLRPQQRTSAFQVTDLWRDDGGVLNTAGSDDDRRTLWFLRIWDATGRDPRHSLVRIETAPDIVATEQINELSAWLLAERLPRAMADTRWATLIYPIHLLERILKRYVDADLYGWPGARAGA